MTTEFPLNPFVSATTDSSTYLVQNLPPIREGMNDVYLVTDALDPKINTAISGGGSVTVHVISDAGQYWPLYEPIEGEPVYLIGYNDPENDTKNLQRAIIIASRNKCPLILTGNFRIRIPEETSPLWEGGWHYIPERPVRICVEVFSNTTIIGRKARIFVEPLRFTLPNTFPKVFLFGTGLNFDIGVIRDITFENLTFDFTDDLGDQYANIYCFGLSGVENFTRKNINFEVSPRVVDVEFSLGNNRIIANNHNFAGRVSGYFETTGKLPDPLEPGKTYWVHRNSLQTDTFRVSLIPQGGPTILLTGEFSGETKFYARKSSGRGILAENVLNWKDENINHYDFVQGYYITHCRTLIWKNINFERFNEAIDIDGACWDGDLSGLSFKVGAGDNSQCIDLSTLSGKISDVYLDDIDVFFTAYNKLNCRPTHRDVYRYTNPNESPVLSTGEILYANNGIPIGGKLYIPEDFTPPANSIDPYRINTIYYVVDKPDANTLVLSNTANGAPITSANTGNGKFIYIQPIYRVGPIDISNVYGTNLRWRSRRTVSISNDVRIRPGVDRSIWRTENPPQCVDLTFRDFYLEKGNGILIEEGENIRIIRGKLANTIAPAPFDDERRAAFSASQSNDEAFTQSFLTLYVEDFEISNCNGSAIEIVSPKELYMDKVRVDGFTFNIANNQASYGLSITNPITKSGSKIINDVTILNGGIGTKDLQIFQFGSSLTDQAPIKINNLTLANSQAVTPTVRTQVYPNIDEKEIVRISSIDTVSANNIQKIIYSNPTKTTTVLSITLKNNLPVTGNSNNYTTARLKSIGPTNANRYLSSVVDIDNISLYPNQRKSIDLSTGINLYPNDVLVVEFSRVGNGSILTDMTTELTKISFTGNPYGWNPYRSNSANLIAYFNAENTATMNVNSDVVMTWTDSINSSIAFTQSTNSARPSLANSSITGRQVLNFDGVDDYMEINTWPYPVNNTTIIIVGTQLRSNATSGVNYIFGVGNGNSAFSYNIYRELDGLRNRLFFGVGDGTTANTAQINTDRWVIDGPFNAAALLSNNTINIIGNNIYAGSRDCISNVVNTFARVGSSTANTPSNFFQGSISAILVYSGILSDEELLNELMWARNHRLGGI